MDLHLAQNGCRRTIAVAVVLTGHRRVERGIRGRWTESGGEREHWAEKRREWTLEVDSGEQYGGGGE